MPIKYFYLVAFDLKLLLEELWILEGPLIDSFNEWIGIFVLKDIQIRSIFELVLWEEEV